MLTHNARILSILFITVFLFLFASGEKIQAKELREHPLIRPFPGSVLAKNMSKYQKFNAFDFYYTNEQTKKREKKKIKGEYYSLLYEVRTSSGARVKDISALEFFENYKNAVIEKGGKILYDGGALTFTLPRDDGGQTWCQVEVNAGLGQQYLKIIDEKGLKQSMTFGPKELKAALDKDGKVLLYGILFDLDKASLKPKSVKQLMHIVTLMQTYPDLYLEVQGHTDSQGSDPYNMTLSQKRAGTVCTFLELFNINPGRLVPKGCGETKPIASNDTKEGRAKNRRVELVKITSNQAASSKSRIQSQPVKVTTAALSPKTKRGSASNSVEGKWQMAPNKRVKAGTMTFFNNNKYLMEENLQDGDRVSKKGEYKINKQVSPPRIDICLMKCGIPGSEYTTSFGIFRFLPNGNLEIRSSPDGKYPKQFSNNSKDGYTMLLTKTS